MIDAASLRDFLAEVSDECEVAIDGDRLIEVELESGLYTGMSIRVGGVPGPDDEGIAVTRSVRMQEVIQQFRDGRLDGMELDDIVTATVSKESSSINNGGVEAQLDYLLKAGVDLETIVKACACE